MDPNRQCQNSIKINQVSCQKLLVSTKFMPKWHKNSKKYQALKKLISVQNHGSKPTLPTAEILSGKNARAFLVCGFLMRSSKKYPENMKKIKGAVWKLPAKQHRQSSPFSPQLGWIDCAIYHATSKWPLDFFVLIFQFLFIF